MENFENKQIEVEIEGKTVKEAVQKAMTLLKVSKQNLKIKVLAEEQKGLFGMQGAKPAKIRASVIKPVVLKKKA